MWGVFFGSTVLCSFELNSSIFLDLLFLVHLGLHNFLFLRLLGYKHVVTRRFCFCTMLKACLSVTPSLAFAMVPFLAPCQELMNMLDLLLHFRRFQNSILNSMNTLRRTCILHPRIEFVVEYAIEELCYWMPYRWTCTLPFRVRCLIMLCCYRGITPPSIVSKVLLHPWTQHHFLLFLFNNYD